MTITTYRLEANELNADFLKALKLLYKGKTISITVKEEMDETEYLLASEANRDMLKEALEAEEGYAFTPDEFENFVKAVEKGQRPDGGQLKKVKLPK